MARQWRASPPLAGQYPSDFFDFIVIDECHRGGANDGELGNTWLRAFQDNEKTIPTILTTSQKLSTGVDARNVRNIVLLRPVNSMIEFKQIIDAWHTPLRRQGLLHHL